MTPDEVWSAWNLDPVVATVVLLWSLHRRGRTSGPDPVADRRRAWAFGAALAALVIALVSPLDALAEVLLSAHMIQHVLLLLVAAPLLAWSAPSGILLRGAPLRVRRVVVRLRGRVRSPARKLSSLGGPVAVWLLHVLTVWIWHGSVAYQAGLANPYVHIAQHATFLGVGVLFWRVVIGTRAGSQRVTRGMGVLLVFGMAMQGVFLSMLMTFSTVPWYPSYQDAVPRWGIDPLTDQHLAGVLMWIPGSILYLGVALTLLLGWLRDLEVHGADGGVWSTPSDSPGR